MITALSHYLENIRDNLRLGFSDEREVINELETHIEDRLQELKEAGLSEEEAAQTCLGLLGSAKLVARQIYEAHSQGTWRQAILASMPHLLFGILFALNWWQHISWLSITLMLILGTAIYGWWHGKPTWVFPWLGYSLLPVVVAGLFLLYLPKGWSWLAIAIYIPLALWWLYSVIVQTIRRDWLFGSVMLLPIPIITGWVLAVAPEGELTEYSRQRIYEFAPWIGLSFLALALAIAAFIRLRQRWLKIAVLTISGLLILTMVAYYANGQLSLSAFLVLILAMWGLFLIPALLEQRIRSSGQRFKNTLGTSD
ncbi:MAG: permease prefix domain 1-containing protein [Dehalococcoidales bacterium]